MFSNASPFTTNPHTPMNANISPINAVNPINPCNACFGSIEPTILTTAANNSIDAPMASKPVFIPSTFIPLPILIEASDILSLAIANIPSTAASAAITPTAFHNFPGLICVKTTTAAAKIAIDIAILCIALACKSHLSPFNTPLKLFNTFPAFSNTSPIPSKALAIPPIASAICLTNHAIVTATPAANNLLHGMLLTIFSNLLIISLPNPEMLSHTSGKAILSPKIRPAIIKPPIAIITVDGEWIPRIPLIASMIP